MNEHLSAIGDYIERSFGNEKGRIAARASLAVLREAFQNAGEPTSFEFRVVSGGFGTPTSWNRCLSKAHAEEMRKPEYAGVIEVRDLYAAPNPEQVEERA